MPSVCCIDSNVSGFSVRTGKILVALAFYKVQRKSDIIRQLSFVARFVEEMFKNDDDNDDND